MPGAAHVAPGAERDATMTTVRMPFDPEPLELRDYQVESMRLIDEGIADGLKRQILCAPTGSGKTVMAAHKLKQVLDAGERGAFICDRISLVRQTSDALWQFGIPHGVSQGEWNENGGLPIQVVSLQTCIARGRWPRADVVFVDEAHSDWEKLRKWVMRRRGPTIGLTATPFTMGLGRTYQGVVNVATTNQLIGEGWIVTPRVFTPDEEEAEIEMNDREDTNSGGEYKAGAVERRSTRVDGHVIKEWQQRTREHFGGAVPTLVFTATVAQGERIAQQFQDAGYDFRQVSYLDRDLDERQRIINAFKRGEVAGLICVDALAKGFDAPNIRCIIDVRPLRRSFAAHIQKLGRGLRIDPKNPDKDWCMVIDHAKNMKRFAELTANFFEFGIRDLDENDPEERKRQLEEAEEREPAVCSQCGLVLMPNDDPCPSCGTPRPAVVHEIEYSTRSFVEFDFMSELNPAGYYYGREQEVWGEICKIAAKRRAQDHRAAYRFAERTFSDLFEFPPNRSWHWPQDEAVLDPRIELMVARAMERRVLERRNG